MAEPSVDALTIVAAGVLAAALGVSAHESAHAVAGWISGGDVVWLSSTGVEGRWSTLRNAGWFFLATSGSAAQGLLALAGWLVFRRTAGGAHLVALSAWTLFAVNAWMPAMYLVASPALGFGDWMDLLVRFAALGPVRVSAAVTGLFVVGLLWKATGETLARLVGGGKGLAIALGSAAGGTWPILVAAPRVGERPVPGPPLTVERSPVLIGAALVAAVLFVGLMGPGIRFD